MDSGNLKGKVWLSTGQTEQCLVLNVDQLKALPSTCTSKEYMSTLQGQEKKQLCKWYDHDEVHEQVHRATI